MNKRILYSLLALGAVAGAASVHRYNENDVAAKQAAFADEAETEAAKMAVDYLNRMRRTPDKMNGKSVLGGATFADKVETASGVNDTEVIYSYEKIPFYSEIDDTIYLSFCDEVKVDLSAGTSQINSLFGKAAYGGRPIHSVQAVGNCHLDGSTTYHMAPPVINVIIPKPNGPTA